MRTRETEREGERERERMRGRERKRKQFKIDTLSMYIKISSNYQHLNYKEKRKFFYFLLKKDYKMISNMIKLKGYNKGWL